MDFREFANRMGNIMSINENISAFIRTLFEAMLPPDRYEDLLTDISSNSFKAYYYGNNSITRLAKKIYAFANPRLFEIFILSLNKNQKLAQAFSDVIPGITPDNAAELIADFFYLIIYEAIKPNIQTIFAGGGANEWLSIKEIPKYLGVTTRTIRNWVKQKKIPHHKVGKSYKFRLTEVNKKFKIK